MGGDQEPLVLCAHKLEFCDRLKGAPGEVFDCRRETIGAAIYSKMLPSTADGPKEIELRI